MSTPAADFFQLPELVHMLAYYLGHKELSRLLRTSHLFKNFVPYLYRSLNLTYRHNRANLMLSIPSMHALARNAAFVHSLRLGRIDTALLYNGFLASQENTDSLIHEPWYTPRDLNASPLVSLPCMGNLTRLVIIFPRRTVYQDEPFTLPSCHVPGTSLRQTCWILQANPHLKRIKARWIPVDGEREFDALSNAFGGLSKLEEVDMRLKIGNDYDQRRWFQEWSNLFLSCSPTIRSFALRPNEGYADEVGLKGEDGSLEEWRTQRVMRPWRMCHGLTELVLAFFEDDFISTLGFTAMSDLRKVLQHCPDLEAFHLLRFLDDAQDVALAAMITTLCPKLKSFSFEPSIHPRSDFVPFSVMLAMKQEQQLEEIDLRHLWIEQDRGGGQWDRDMSIARQAFQRHSLSLRVINMHDISDSLGHVLATVLVECLALEEFNMYRPGAGDRYVESTMPLLEAATAASWGCTKLKRLALGIEKPILPGYPFYLQPAQSPVESAFEVFYGSFMDSFIEPSVATTPTIAQPFYRRSTPIVFMEEEKELLALLERLYHHIGTLTELQSLDLRAVDSPGGSSQSEDSRYTNHSFPALMTVGNSAPGGRPGYLHLLGGLTKLEKLRGSVYASTDEGKTTMGWDEARWMHEHWPRLRLAEFYYKDEEPTEPFLWLKSQPRAWDLEMSVFDCKDSSLK